MTNDQKRPTGTLSDISTYAAAGARCLIAALLVFISAPVQAQTAGDVLRPWNCLAMSVAVDSIFKPIPPPGCTVPGVAWSGMAPARAINPPGIPRGLTADVIGHTIVLTWARPEAGGTPASYFVQAGSATGLANGKFPSAGWAMSQANWKRRRAKAEVRY